MEAPLRIDLSLSGLSADDLHARELGPTERAAANVPKDVEGYVIPYFSLSGKPLPFYRVKLIDHKPKYKQPKNTLSHVYFPPDFLQVLNTQLVEAKKSANGISQRYVIITEGEKKAAASCKAGIPCVALGGVYNWRSKAVYVPQDTKIDTVRTGKGKSLKIELPDSANLKESVDLAVGLEQFISLVETNSLDVVIVFDTDEDGGLKPDVQKAAAQFGHELRYRGVTSNHVVQVVLPQGPDSNEKVGLDDYLLREDGGADKLRELMHEALANRAFPRMPNVREYLNRKLGMKLTRKEVQEASMVVLCELDARGQRYKSKTSGVPYYFDEDTKRLMQARLLVHGETPLHESPFGTHLYRQFGIGLSDTRILNWIASQYMGEAPVDEAEPARVLTLSPENPDNIAVQLSDSTFALVSKDSIDIYYNGSLGILFEEDRVRPIDEHKLRASLKKQTADMHKRKGKIRPWWREVFKTVALKHKELNENHTRNLATLLFYMSPWLLRWRGTQLPIELTIGDPGSGKSSLYTLRLQIMTGNPKLSNMPNDIRDWYSSVIANGGLYAIDNVVFAKRELKQRLSDEMCRIVTEKEPHIEMRKLYTTAQQEIFSVHTTFAMTAIQMPFNTTDLIQRSNIFHLEKPAVDEVEYDSEWAEHQLESRGGREAWLAHHLLVLQRFMQVAAEDWDPSKPAKHRLVHYEQCMQIMAKVLGISDSWIPQALNIKTEAGLSEADWVLEGLRAYALRHLRIKPEGFEFTTSTVQSWAEGDPEYEDNSILTNPRSLGRYMKAHHGDIWRVAGIKESRMYGNKQRYMCHMRDHLQKEIFRDVEQE